VKSGSFDAKGRKMNQAYIMKGAEPFFLAGNSIGCLMIHGFTGTPREMRGMGEYLNKVGFTVYGLRLAGHATQIRDLVRSRWQDWIISMEEGIYLLSTNCSQVFTLGLSMGGILSLIAADRYDIQGSVCMSTPYEISQDWRLKFARQLSFFVPSVSKGINDMKNEQAARTHLDYPVYPTRAIAELRDLQNEMHRVLPRINKPVLLMHSKSDGLSIHNSEKILELLGCRDKELILLEKSGHIITEDIEHQFVYKKAEEFIKRMTRT
jgi:carboxylesterase